jgi:uncharacterized membrane protein YraQ (UPF0718 family)/YHS domain-containing protein
MERAMGDHRAPAIARASAFGALSSSCSYAATAMGKSLFQKGADFISAMVFMFASTNLVIELGIVLVVLMGWEFGAAEFVGGPIMIVLLAAFGGLVLTRRHTDPARVRVRQGAIGGHDHDAMTGVSAQRQKQLDREPWREKLSSRAAWSDAASYTMADVTMLRRELVIGYLVAGILTVFVSPETWNDVFLSGHGFWTSAWNAVAGPFIAIVSFVCSIGNVPLAAALWHGGIAFGGVIAFLFADLITFPLLLIYRKYYGTAVMLRMLVVFWVVMSAAGLIVEGIFTVLGIVPTDRPPEVAHEALDWNYTTALNIVFLVVFGVLFWLHRTRRRSGGRSGFTSDPVCGMPVQTAHAPAQVEHEDRSYSFCSDVCRDRFVGEPTDFVGSSRFRARPGP